MFKNLARASFPLGATLVVVSGHHSERSLR